MDAYALAAVFAITAAFVIGIACCLAIRRERYRWPFIALFAVPATVLLIEVAAFPSNLDGVTSLTGVFTMMFSVVWVPYWIIMAIVGIWTGPKPPPEV